MKVFLSLIAVASLSSSAFADWKQESIEGLQTQIYLPKVSTPLRTTTGMRPLMVHLHGCAQKPDDIKTNGNWVTTADEYNMVVAVPLVPNGGKYAGCWDYYGANHTLQNRDNAPIYKMVKSLLGRVDLNIDPNQVYIAGLSSGGGEAMVMGCLAPDMFAGMALNAAPSVGTSVNEIAMPPSSIDAMISNCKQLAGDKVDRFKTQTTSIIYGSNDFIVNTKHDTNNLEVMKKIYGATTSSPIDMKTLPGVKTDGQGSLWMDEKGATKISFIMNANLGHNWPAGQGGNGANYISKNSINYPAYVAKFFTTNNKRTRLAYLPELVIDPVAQVDSRILLSGQLSIAPAYAKEIQVSVLKSEDGSTVETFPAYIANDGRFTGATRPLPSGEYYFSIKLVNVWGWNRTFFRNAWVGAIPNDMPPQLFNVNLQAEKDCLNLKGQAVVNSGSSITGIRIDVDGQTLDTANVDVATFWKSQICGLDTGKHDVAVYAVNERGLRSQEMSYKVDIDLNSATSSLQDHMQSGRLKWETYGTWFLKYGDKSFTLYLGADGVWSDVK